MPAVDYERAMVRVKALIASKASHGRDTLLRQVVEIEHECELDEGQDLYDDRPAPRRPVSVREQQRDGTFTEHETASHEPDLFKPLGDGQATERAIA